MELKQRKLNRLKNFDYSQEGYYFITINTKKFISYFGEIKNKKMILNPYGKILEKQWLWLAKQYKYLQLDEYTIMPNHFHGILIIDSPSIKGGGNLSVRNTRECSVQSIWGEHFIQKKIKPIPELIGAFKTTSSKLIHLAGLNEFKWHKSYYDHIIRNEITLYNIRKYIKENPLAWEE